MAYGAKRKAAEEDTFLLSLVVLVNRGKKGLGPFTLQRWLFSRPPALR